MVPKLPLALLAVVFALWWWDARGDARVEEVARRKIEGPTIDLLRGSPGVWDVKWPEWPKGKGDPYLFAELRPMPRTMDGFAVGLYVRATPPDCLHPATCAALDEQGWCEAGRPFDGSTWPTLEAGRPCAIEYEVRGPVPPGPEQAVLRIAGRRDSLLWEGLSVRSFIRTVAAVLASIPLLSWIGLVWWRRRKAARRAEIA